MKKITFNVPTTTGTATREGYRIWLTVGATKRAFVLQVDGYGYALADYATGMLMAGLNALKARMLMRYVAHPYGYSSHFSVWRRVAQQCVDDAVVKVGADAMLADMAIRPVLNGPLPFAARVEAFKENNLDGHY